MQILGSLTQATGYDVSAKQRGPSQVSPRSAEVLVWWGNALLCAPLLQGLICDSKLSSALSLLLTEVIKNLTHGCWFTLSSPIAEARRPWHTTGHWRC